MFNAFKLTPGFSVLFIQAVLEAHGLTVWQGGFLECAHRCAIFSCCMYAQLWPLLLPHLCLKPHTGLFSMPPVEKECECEKESF